MYNEVWSKIDSDGDVLAAQYRFPGGTSRSLLIRLSDRSFLAYSPGKTLLESAMQILGRDSEVILLAPSSAHSLGLDKWKGEFSNSRVVASDAAAPRLLKRTSLEKVDDLALLQGMLPAHMAVHVVPACSWGEVWLSIDVDGKVHWAVCDAFFNLAALSNNLLLRSLMKLGRLGPGLEISRAFRYVGISDKHRYREWAIQTFSNGRENVLIPCHGDIYDRADSTERAVDLLRKRF
jgi:hypothetical protein